jgi:hypothetical protein
VCIGLVGKEHGRRPHPSTVRKRLLDNRLPLLKNRDGSTFFRHNGERIEFFVVSNVAEIARYRWAQEEFEKVTALDTSP